MPGSAGAMVAMVAEALRALVPPPGADEGEYQPAFQQIAELLLDRVIWHVGGREHRLTEVEFYFAGPGHQDPFTHGDPIQRTMGRWYFHRQGGTYRGGTYKGLDVTFGREDAFGGILLRGAVPLDAPEEMVEGPSSLVDHVLRLTGHASVAALAGSFDLRVDAPEEGGGSLHLTIGDPRGLAICECARVGLSLKKGADAARRRYLAAPYRFLSEPARTKKGRPYLVVGLHRQGLGAGEIAARAGMSAAQVGAYVAAYERGKGRDPEQYRRDLSPEELCELLGAVSAH
jgi:hypothetical protein